MSFLRQLLIYGIAGTASRLVGVILVPLYTRAFSVADYGTFEILLAVYLLATLITGWQSESGLARDHHEASRDDWDRALIWSAVRISLAGFGFTVLLVLGAYLIGIVPAVLAPYLPWVVALVLPTQLVNLQLIVLRFTHRPMAFAIFSVADLLISAFASVILVRGLDLGIIGAVLGLLAGKSVVAVLAWATTFGRLPPRRPDREVSRRVLRYGTPLMLPAILNWTQKYGSSILLALLLTLTDVGIAGFALKIAAIFEIAALSFRQAWDPFAFRQLADPEAAQPVFRRGLAFYTVVMGAGAGIIILLAPLATTLLAPPAYALADSLAGLFIMAQFWSGAVSILALGLHGARRISRIALSHAIGTLINIALVVLLSHVFGIVVAGIGALAGAVTTALLAAHLSERTFAIRFDWRLLIVSSIATAAFAMLTYAVRAPVAPIPVWIPLPAEAICAISYIGMVAVLALFGLDRTMIADLPKLRNRPKEAPE
jgi:O-antigen/teichoic acid export membrane protein